MRFPRQEYRSGLLLSSPEDLPDPGFKLASLVSSALTGRFFTTSDAWEAPVLTHGNVKMSGPCPRKHSTRLLVTFSLPVPSGFP